MSININHKTNTFSSESGQFIFGTGIIPNIEDAVYSNNFSGKYYGDGSSLTGIATGCFITGIDTSSFLTSSSQLLDASGSLLLNTVAGFSSEGSQNITLNAGASSSILTGSDKNFIVTSDFATISSGSCRNAIVGGVFSAVGPNVCNSIILGGSFINANESNTVYASNFCAANGSYYGNGSGLTDLATGCFITGVDLSNYITTGATGDFVKTGELTNYVTTGATGIFITTGMTGAFGGGGISLDNSGSLVPRGGNNNEGCYNLIFGTNNTVSGCYNLISATNGKISNNANSNLFAGTEYSKICQYACANAIIGGYNNTINQFIFGSAILGGTNIVANSYYTAYSNNFCAYNGKYYGDGSALTGIAAPPKQKSILLTGATGFTQYHQAKNVGILAQNCFVGETINSGYLLLDKGGENETNNLFAISSSTYCVGTFSAMLIGMGYIDQGGPITTSMRIDGTYGNGVILNQVKNIYYRTQDLNDANVIIEDNNFKIVVSGISGTMVWSSKIDLLDMNGYD
jgi:hypothetical protein